MNEVKNLAKKFDKVIKKLIDDINERFNIYNKLIFELDERLIEQDKKIESLKTDIEELQRKASQQIEGDKNGL